MELDLTKKQSQAIAVSLLLVGAVFVMNSTGVIDFEDFMPTSVSTREGTAGISTSSTAGSIQSGALLSTVNKGTTYQWKVDMSNTGSLAWDNSRYTLRLSKSLGNSDIGQIGTALIQEYFGKMSMVLSGNYNGQSLTNDERLRDSICSEWNLAYKVGKDGSWSSVDCGGTKVGGIRFGSMDAGESKAIYFKMDVPSDLQYTKKRYLVGNGVAVVGDTYIVDHNSDGITAGTVSGSTSLTFIGGIAAALVGAALLAGKF